VTQIPLLLKEAYRGSFIRTLEIEFEFEPQNQGVTDAGNEVQFSLPIFESESKPEREVFAATNAYMAVGKVDAHF
jgi:hypothetical protein